MVRVDTLYTNANVLTLDNKNKRADIVAAYDGNIIGVWTHEQYKQIKEVLVIAETVDLEGKTMIPGFIDTHNHLLMYALNKGQVNCSSERNKSIDDILANLRAFGEKTTDDSWILGYGYDDTLLAENRHPTRYDLDQVSTDRPIFIKHISNHLAVANSCALQLAQVDDSIQDPAGGHFGRDENGQLTGVLYEPAAMDLVFKYAPTPSDEEVVQLIERAAQDYLVQGITTSSDAGIGLVLGPKEYELHMKALQDDANPLRMRFMVMYDLLSEGGRFAQHSAEELDSQIQQDSHGKARLDSAKLFQDGSIQGLTGALRKPYYCDDSLVGDLIMSQEELNQYVQDFHDRGFRVTTHGNGDRAIGSIIEAYQQAIDNSPKADHRHRIEHVQTATSEDLQEMKKYDIAASFFINHVYYWGDRHKRIFLGPERAERMNALKEASELGMLYTLHSDCPITPISPLFSIWAAVNRITREGNVLGENQKIDVIEALKSMTIYGAQLNFDEKTAGTIEVGKAADFAILDNDPTAVSPVELNNISVEMTIINGKTVYQKTAVKR
ncbi:MULTISPECIES: amidohydrolase [unclassified Sporosarcina]|uniref:amidohydrolase n=1 Tax=unclassified Sporosarcina TaxID=2647733 RepID=UPI00203B989D|nr:MULTISPECIES: amidohydrolase [unclassified Sporosarcina]GKV65874.1 amidohydrolase [Sporosarcina sp. NCCP-2331]GLB55999.1 amidohydrolase [Sporosarcina sp. NCCP-2378]